MFSSNSLSAQIIVALILSGSSLGIGYYLGSHSASHLDSADAALNPQSIKTTSKILEASHDTEDETDEEEISDGDLSAIRAGFMEPCKLVLVVRTDLQMTSGKISAQCGHATLACYKALVKKNPQLVKHWECTGQAKIALKATSEDKIIELEAIAKSLNLCARSIQDQGRTQVAAGSRTVLGIGPAPVELVNQVTGKLRLL